MAVLFLLPHLFHGKEILMSYKLDGAKFPSLEELVEALYPLYSDKMSLDEFKKYAEEHAEKS
jgi:hypothetical protein